MTDIRILQGNCFDQLPTIADETIQCVVTSPPYFNQRNYCVDGQIGLEATVAEYVEKLVMVFREIKRVLRKDGVAFLNLGDTYSQRGGHVRDYGGKQTSNRGSYPLHAVRDKELGPKQLLMIPARVALALQANGWILRNDIIYAKKNPMPESVKDRCTRSHEHVFLLTKSPEYFWDTEAIREPLTGREEARVRAFGCAPDRHDTDRIVERDITIGANARDVWRDENDETLGHEHILMLAKTATYYWDQDAIREPATGRTDPITSFGSTPERKDAGRRYEMDSLVGANARDVWWLSPKPFKGSKTENATHFATMPPALAERCILAGSRVGDHVLDPFAGAGTTGAVAQQLGRDATLIELNADYVKLMKERLGIVDWVSFANGASDRADGPIDRSPSTGADTHPTCAADHAAASSDCDAEHTDLEAPYHQDSPARSGGE